MSHNLKPVSKRYKPDDLGSMVARVAFNKREVAKLSFKAVLKDCSNKILHTARYSKDEFIIYDVPAFLLGHSVYNRNDCLNYIKEYMIKVKMSAAFIPPFSLCISWNDKINVNHVVDSVVPSTERKNVTSSKGHINANMAKKLKRVEQIARGQERHKEVKQEEEISTPLSLINAMMKN